MMSDMTKERELTPEERFMAMTQSLAEFAERQRKAEENPTPPTAEQLAKWQAHSEEAIFVKWESLQQGMDRVNSKLLAGECTPEQAEASWNHKTNRTARARISFLIRSNEKWCEKHGLTPTAFEHPPTDRPPPTETDDQEGTTA